VEVLKRLGCTAVEIDRSRCQVDAMFGFTWRSWGQKLEISVSPGDDGSIVVLRTWPRIAVTVADWGAGNKLLRRVADELDSTVATSPT
jgi:hypothetical protein